MNEDVFSTNDPFIKPLVLQYFLYRCNQPSLSRLHCQSQDFYLLLLVVSLLAVARTGLEVFAASTTPIFYQAFDFQTSLLSITELLIVTKKQH